MSPELLEYKRATEALLRKTVEVMRSNFSSYSDEKLIYSLIMNDPVLQIGCAAGVPECTIYIGALIRYMEEHPRPVVEQSFGM